MDKRHTQLLELFDRLRPGDQETLRAFAEFLVARNGIELATTVPEPRPIPRPEEESVVGAIRRLSDAYFMVDRSKMLHETSALMAQHLMQGRAAAEVIDELEIVFRRHYERQFSEKE